MSFGSSTGELAASGSKSNGAKRGVALLAAAAATMSTFTVATVTSATSAGAACDGGDRHHSVRIFPGWTSQISGRGKTSNLSGGRERWCDLWEEEEWIGTLGFPPNPFKVCDYQSQMAVYNPDGSAFNGGTVHTNSMHHGCSITGWGYHDPLEGVYVEDKRFASKWRSDVTTNNDWDLIGYLTD